MSTARSYYQLITYGDAVYAIGGYNSGGELNTMERYRRIDGWKARANLPYKNHG